MKKIILTLLVAGAASLAVAQKVPVKPVVKPATQPILKNKMDSVSYILGVFIGKNLKAQGFEVGKINKTLFNTALTEIASGKTPVIDDATGNNIINNYMQEQKEKEGKAFLTANGKRPGVKTTASGLQYEILTQGTGAMMTPLDTFICHYRGTLIDGTEFDASYNRGTPLKMSLTGVIKGWQEGLLLMPAGTKFKLYIPANLGYGMMGQGNIPPGAVLIFEMELIDIARKQN